jgi:hypothetical protein
LKAREKLFARDKLTGEDGEDLQLPIVANEAEELDTDAPGS